MATHITYAPLLIKLSSRGLDSISGEVVYFLELRMNESVQILMKFFRLVMILRFLSILLIVLGDPVVLTLPGMDCIGCWGGV